MDKQAVVIVDIKIPFSSMVVMSLKWAVAIIPAFIVFFVLANYLMFALNNFPRL